MSSSNGWRLASTVREAIANLLSAKPRLVVLMGLLGVGFGTVMWSELEVTRTIIRDANHLSERGGYIWIATSDDGNLAGGTCSLVGQDRHVLNAGATRQAGTVTFPSAPGLEFRHLEATQGAVRVWDQGAELPAGAGYVLGSAVAREVGLVGATEVSLTDRGSSVATVLSAEDRNELLGRSVVSLVAPHDSFEQCWVEVNPYAQDYAHALLSATFLDPELVIRPLIRIDRDLVTDHEAEFSSRPQRHAWLPSGLVMSLAVAVLAITRRSEFAVYRSFGVPRSGIVIQLQLETAAGGFVAFMSSGAWVTLAYTLLNGPPSLGQMGIAFSTGTLAYLLVVLVGPGLGALLSRGNPAQLLKD